MLQLIKVCLSSIVSSRLKSINTPSVIAHCLERAACQNPSVPVTGHLVVSEAEVGRTLAVSASTAGQTWRDGAQRGLWPGGAVSRMASDRTGRTGDIQCAKRCWGGGGGLPPRAGRGAVVMHVLLSVGVVSTCQQCGCCHPEVPFFLDSSDAGFPCA